MSCRIGKTALARNYSGKGDFLCAPLIRRRSVWSDGSRCAVSGDADGGRCCRPALNPGF